MATDDEGRRRRLGRTIAEARGSRSQDWLAERLDVHQTTVSDWERGISSPRLNRLVQLESVLGLADGTLRAIMMGDTDVPARERAAFSGRYHELSEEDRAIVDSLIDQLWERDQR